MKYENQKRAADFFVLFMRDLERDCRRDLMYELGPILCARHYAPGACEGPLVMEYLYENRVVPCCAHHVPFLLQDTKDIVHVQLGVKP